MTSCTDPQVAIASSTRLPANVSRPAMPLIGRRSVAKPSKKSPAVFMPPCGEPRATRVEVVPFAWHRGEVMA
ncbi:MAG: hypothetical protein KF817_00420 [Phycisphaeraceae bacterium]|nr:hypothetical protein [Phycisphaeraceae bacterium]